MPAPRDLVYYPDNQPGIRRERRGTGFSYVAPDGTRIQRGAERKRIEALAVPPAYENVWICPLPYGHLQATGLDARTRKQYRYHPDWRAWRESHKFDHLVDFGEALPAIRRRIRRDLSGEAGDLDFAIAAVLALIDRMAIRVGNPEYASENHTYGATTLTGRHIKLDGDRMELRFTAKGGHKVRKTIRDRGLNKVFGQLHDLPGKQLIRWIDDEGEAHGVSSEQVNHRLSDIVGTEGITAKTFRTWAGSEAALSAALQPGKLTIKAVSEAASERLHNTPTIARNSYIHPRVIALTEATEKERLDLLRELPEREGLRQAERALLRLLS
ncbi:DNA topoisomerase IB [Pseudoroseicyclus aestuarii]|uniref:DNA topoisomerase n=1 Tax=Pseudoroseicyclus aestuarii TaxID=1795041 RepID=A0A318T2T9_9RHOB|nr:DNA topoisomerase IB [Pseudoroseicyclus aestuarii]PYE84534.1 DNA topoisomerase-1 [Pseudoroseicyclus aestuarii]